jgi:hypothetical protein
MSFEVVSSRQLTARLNEQAGLFATRMHSVRAICGKQSVATSDGLGLGLDSALGAARQQEAARRCRVVIVMNFCSLIVVGAFML